jgi:hypothetical protein
MTRATEAVADEAGDLAGCATKQGFGCDRLAEPELFPARFRFTS